MAKQKQWRTQSTTDASKIGCIRVTKWGWATVGKFTTPTKVTYNHVGWENHGRTKLVTGVRAFFGRDLFWLELSRPTNLAGPPISYMAVGKRGQIRTSNPIFLELGWSRVGYMTMIDFHTSVILTKFYISQTPSAAATANDLLEPVAVTAKERLEPNSSYSQRSCYKLRPTTVTSNIIRSITMYQIDLFRTSPFVSLPAWGPISCSRPRGTQGPACTPQRKCGPGSRSVGRALGLQTRELWQIAWGRRADLTRLDTASRLPCKTYRTSVFASALIVMLCFFPAA